MIFSLAKSAFTSGSKIAKSAYGNFSKKSVGEIFKDAIASSPFIAAVIAVAFYSDVFSDNFLYANEAIVFMGFLISVVKNYSSGALARANLAIALSENRKVVLLKLIDTGATTTKTKEFIEILEG